MGKAQPKIYFVKNGQRIPFSEWLIQQRTDRNLSWKELDELCGINRMDAYALNTSNGKPNCPTTEKFESIITNLGYSTNNFEIQGILNAHNPSKEFTEESKREIGDKALARDNKNRNIIRTPFIKLKISTRL